VKKPLPTITITLVLATLIASCVVATVASGAPWSNVGVLKLRNYGAVNNQQLMNGEWWRLLTSQFIHVRQLHMLFNIVALFFVGSAVERAVGPLKFWLIWLLSGVAGMWASIYRVPPPFDVGSGASQALMGVVGAGVVIVSRNNASPRRFRSLLVLVGLIQVAIDIGAARYPKPGHVAAFVVGSILAYCIPTSSDISQA